MSTSDPFNVAFANQARHKSLCEQLEQIRDRQTSDDHIKLEAALIIAECQAPLLDIIEQMQDEFNVLKEYL